MSLRMLFGWICALSLALPAAASAQTLDNDQAAASTDVAADPDTQPGATSLTVPVADTQSTSGTEPSEVSSDNGHSGDGYSARPELPDHDYFAVGLVYRQVFIPSFIQNLFVHSSLDASNPGRGLQFNYRRNNFNIIVDAWWNKAGGTGAFRGLGADHPPTGRPEIVAVNIEPPPGLGGLDVVLPHHRVVRARGRLRPRAWARPSAA